MLSQSEQKTLVANTAIDTLIEKGVDVSAVYDGVTISFKKRVALNEDLKKLYVVK